ncbi:MAG TPA: ORF6N domain-containing protein [Bryobacteraceae bacterium]|nr:ORF6N domain-containing protein [Bryobacteraceae bacterium]
MTIVKKKARKRQLRNQRRLPVLVELVESRISLLRTHKIMIDTDLAELYGVTTKRLNEGVKRNLTRFPGDFMFQLTVEEADVLRSQIATSKENRGGRRYLPYAFTEQGVAMLSSVLNSERAVQVNIAIMRAFVKLREVMSTHKDLALKIEALERQYLNHDDEIQVIFRAIKKLLEPSPKSSRRRIGFRHPDEQTPLRP